MDDVTAFEDCEPVFMQTAVIKYLQRSAKKYANLAKQDPGRASKSRKKFLATTSSF